MKGKTRPYMVRLHDEHHAIIKKFSKKMKIKESEFVRYALELAASNRC